MKYLKKYIDGGKPTNDDLLGGGGFYIGFHIVIL